MNNSCMVYSTFLDLIKMEIDFDIAYVEHCCHFLFFGNNHSQISEKGLSHPGFPHEKF